MTSPHPHLAPPPPEGARAQHRKLIRSFSTLFETEALTMAVLLEALERKSDGVMLLGPRGEIAFLDDRGNAVLQEADGLTVELGRLVAARRSETRKLNESTRGATAGSARNERRWTRVLVTRPSGKGPYVLYIAPAPAVDGADAGSSCVVHIVDLGARAELSKDAACATFGLSDREGDLAVELTRCSTLRAAAARAGMALNTARNHMRSVFAKCRVHSRLELSRILMRLI